jgi:hypothetical protein
MAYHVYVHRDGELVVSYVERDETRGVIGRLTAKSASIGTSESLKDAVEIGYAYLGRHPSESICIANDADEVHESLVSHEYIAEREALQKSGFIGKALLVLCCVSFAGSVALELGFVGLAVFAGIALVYVYVVRTGIQNEGEGAVVCLIILVLIFLLIPSVRAARDRAKKAKQETSRLSGSAIEEKFCQEANLLNSPKIDQKSSS